MAVASVSEVAVPGDGAVLPGRLRHSQEAFGLVIFAHGSGSSRLSPRNAAVADALADAGLDSLLFDLLTDAESRDRRLVFDIPFLTDRLRRALAWARGEPRLRGLDFGLFGASTGAAAALGVAASDPEVRAVVSRGGRPDLASDLLAAVRAPTLLIVGERDTPVLACNRAALGLLGGHARLEIVPGATHLFEEPGALGRVSSLACAWFEEFLGKDGQG